MSSSSPDARVRARGAPRAARAGEPRSGYSRRRALTLLAVHVAIGAHVLHWKLSGRTLAPLELNEVMYTLELGIVTAGAIFMGLVLLTVLVFGRFFCSWGCHVLALQDLCAWLLERAGIRPRPLRSRALMLVPLGAMLYMFVWPQVSRLLAGRSLPRLTISEEGWASFVTDDFWRNLPPVGTAALTLAVCGFGLVYLLGSRSFCRSVCPYGAVFALADRLAPGRITSIGPCDACGACTAACSSGVRVHEELAAYGTLVDPACLKDLDCVAVCPRGSIGYRFTWPALFRSRRDPALRIRRQWAFGRGEELLLAGAFLLALPILRGLYGAVPFFLAMALAAAFAFAAVWSLRSLRRADLRLRGWSLVRAGRRGAAGYALLALTLGAAAFLAHSGRVRYHQFRGERAYARFVAAPAEPERQTALEHLARTQRLGLRETPGVQRKLAHLEGAGPEPARAEPHLRAHLARQPQDAAARMDLARRLALRGELTGALTEVGRARAFLVRATGPDAAHAQFEAWMLEGGLHAARGARDLARAAYARAAELEPHASAPHLALSELESLDGRLAAAAQHLSRALELDPDSADGHYNLGVLRAASGDAQAALAHYGAALRLDPGHVDAANNLGLLLAAHGEHARAEVHFRRCIALDPGHAAAHFNLGSLLALEGRAAEARVALERAAALDERYAQALVEHGPPPGRP